MSKVLVTGGAGYIGVPAVRELLHKGYVVRVLDKGWFGEEPLSRFRSKIELLIGKDGDIRNPPEGAFEGVDAVVHLAGFSNDPTAEFRPDINDQVNIDGTRIIAERAIKAGVKRFTFGSSGSIYDQGTTGSEGLLNEESKVNPRAAYSVSKFKGERVLLDLMKEHPEFEPVIFRQGTVYGWSPRMRYDLVVNTMVKSAMSGDHRIRVFCGGTQWRPLVEVSDVARAHIAAIEAPTEKVKGEVFNLAIGNYRMMDLAHLVKNTLKGLGVQCEVDVEETPDRIDRSYNVDGKKIRGLGFEYRVPIKDAVKEMYDRINAEKMTDFDSTKYYNIKRLEELVSWEERLKRMGGVF